MKIFKQNKLTLVVTTTLLLLATPAAFASQLVTTGGILIPTAFVGNPGTYNGTTVTAPSSSGSYFLLSSPFAASSAWTVTATISGTPFLALCTTANCSSFSPYGINAASGSLSFTNSNTANVGTAYGLFFGSFFGTTTFTNFNLVFNSTQVQKSTTAVHNNTAYNAAGVIDETPALLSLFTNANLSTDQQVSAAVSQILPLLTGGSFQAVNGALFNINQVIGGRLQGGSSGDGYFTDKYVWVKPFGSWAKQDDQNGVSGFKANTTGLAVGADAKISPQLRLGAAFAYAKSDVDSNSSAAAQSNKVDVFQLVGYGSYALPQNLNLDFQADVGQNRNHGERTIAFTSTVASSVYDSYTAHAGLGLGRNYQLSEKTSVTPELRADYTWIKDKAYQESGAGLLNLNVDSRSTEQFVLGLDGKLDHKLNDSTTLNAKLGVGYDTLAKRNSITATFAGAPGAAFTTYGLNPDPWIEHVGLGLTHTTQSGAELSINYDAEHRDGYNNQTASLKARWAF
ncbi:autotransporter outer membrane beta-barrel domain-containing protein [Vogesella sp. LIG4]|uniref:autotransporter outer membrane beta-barrel domain-containing protein n=1 Tax=Vogesella sp. LIG4 TaxID=1192162 RepID=UPI00081F857A|nr:autotransporter outer membrane beta-barrel domain-containing protein [Vogesella sp. LIG4]SCK20624.1 outer membrane autotransporter barrel domain-containing protein [Vogesella sp. LIG4]